MLKAVMLCPLKSDYNFDLKVLLSLRKSNLLRSKWRESAMISESSIVSL